MFLDALVCALSARGHQILAASGDPEDAVELVLLHRPDLCVLDVGFAGRSGLDAVADIRRADSDTSILLLTGAATDAVWLAYDNFAVDGVVNKVCDISVLEAAINRITAGDRIVEGFRRRAAPRHTFPRAGALTRREQQVLELLVKGASTETIATEMGVSGNTVRTHVQNVLHKLGVNGRGKAAQVAVERALVGLESAAS
jgi:DNA-binding NarL/FixJ family response regulator